MTVLSQFLNNHGVPDYVYDDPQDVLSWLEAVPNPSQFQFLMYAFPLLEQGNLFVIRDVANWYGLLCHKVANAQDIEVIMLGNTTITRRNKIKQFMGLFIKELVEMALFDVDMQSLVNHFMKRSPVALQVLLTLLVADGVLTEPTLLKLQVELSPFPRWQSIGLLTPPTINDIITELPFNTL